MKRGFVVRSAVGGAVTLSVLLASGAETPEGVPSPLRSAEGCTTSGCHAEVTDWPRLHGPVAVDACDACHVMMDEAAHVFALARTGPDLCTFCHSDSTTLADDFVHRPVEEGRCLTCHDPHGSRHEMLLAGATPGETCLGCHETVVADRAHQHTPVADGACLSCHRAHASSMPSLLVAAGRELCLTCHADVLVEDDATTSAAAVVRHPPVEASCVSCHEVHASAHEGLLVAEGIELCATCHETVAAHAAAAIVPHAPAVASSGCTECHSPHQSLHAALLREDAIATCLACHGEDIKREDGTIVAGVGHLAAGDDARLVVHTPIRTDGCRGCHDAHGGERSSLLTGAFPKSMYQRFGDGEAYALCFSCHDRRLVDEGTTTTATGFRNGDRNLHTAHVDLGDRAGRSCRVCHDPHASERPHLTRATAPFGAWKIPIDLEVTETGGGCSAGCHQARKYDRVTPVR